MTDEFLVIILHHVDALEAYLNGLRQDVYGLVAEIRRLEQELSLCRPPPPPVKKEE